MFSSFSKVGVHLYFINSPMEKFKVFHGNYTHEDNDMHRDDIARAVRSIISSAIRNVLSFEAIGINMEPVSIINAA